MYKAPSPFNSLFASQTSPLPMLIWGTSPQHPNKVHKYVETCHLVLRVSKSSSPPLSTHLSNFPMNWFYSIRNFKN
jgi:hypothetical protein